MSDDLYMDAHLLYEENKMTKPDLLPCLPLRYRPDEYDDWGVIKDANGKFICQARSAERLTDEQLNEHRRNNTDPHKEVAMLIVNSVNVSTPNKTAEVALDTTLNNIHKRQLEIIDAANSHISKLSGGNTPQSDMVAVVTGLDTQWRNGIEWAIGVANDRQTIIDRLVNLCERMITDRNEKLQPYTKGE